MNKKKNYEHNQKHLTLSDRTFIEQELSQGSSFKSIAAVLGKDPTTISKEVKLHRVFFSNYMRRFGCRICSNYKQCREHNVCDNKTCKYSCRHCRHRSVDVIDICPFFKPHQCDRLNKAPYVCNNCSSFHLCVLDTAKYIASKAQKQYEKTLSQSRTGINMTPEELRELNDLISPLVMKGQPLSHVFAVHGEEIPVCRRTLYNY